MTENSTDEPDEEDMKRRKDIISDLLSVLDFHNTSFAEGTAAMFSVMYTALEVNGCPNVDDELASTLEDCAKQLREREVTVHHMNADRGRAN